MSFQFRQATRSHTPLLIGLMGPSGCGKTYSALKLATGMAGGKPIYGIDTEANRMRRYSGEFDFQHGELTEPFSPLRYLEAIKTAADAGAGCIIVDSISHEHEGPGGVLEMHEAELERMAGNDYQKRERMKWTAWIKPKQQRQRLINTILQINCNFVFCFRAKEKLKMIKNKTGKTEVVPIGWQPIAAAEFAFEMTTIAVLPPNAKGVPDWNAEACKIEHHHRFAFPEGQALNEETGRLMAEWAASGTSKSNPTASTPRDAAPEGSVGDPGRSDAPLSEEHVKSLLDEAHLCARRSRTDFNQFWTACSDLQQQALEPHQDALRAELEKHPKVSGEKPPPPQTEETPA